MWGIVRGFHTHAGPGLPSTTTSEGSSGTCETCRSPPGLPDGLDNPGRMTSIFNPMHDLEQEILKLKRERNAVLLAHFYQYGEIQDVADFLGDSLQLAQAAQKTKADVILFAGVHFMAETAKILNPDRIVVVPDLDAGCSLADGCPADKFRAWRSIHPEAVAISYINCSAAVKAESDYICTSSNAEKVVRAVPEGKQILFAPDRNLGRFVAKQTGRDMLLWSGSCVVHETFSERKMIALRERHPKAEIIAHTGMRRADPSHGEVHRLHQRAAQVRDIKPLRGVHRRHGAWDPAPDEEGSAGQDLPCRPSRQGGVRVQRMRVHEEEHVGEGVPGAPRPEAAH